MPRKEKIKVDISANIPERKPTWLGLRILNKKLIKLNEELTAENARLLQERDIISEDLLKLQKDYNSMLNSNIRTGGELTSIKSKWWYKLMTWGW